MGEVAQLKPSTGFDLKPANLNEAMNLATMISKSCLAPKDFKDKPDDTLVAMMLGNELGLNPLQSIQNIAVVNGRPSVWGDALLALVQNHPAFGYIEETFDDATMTAKCVVGRKGGKPHTSTFSKADAETAGLWGRNTWKQYPKRMLAMRARGFALRNQFADALLGLVTREEAMDMPVGEIDMGNLNIVEDPANDKPAGLPPYPEEKLKANLRTWQGYFKSGKSTPESLIGKIKSKNSLTPEQESLIRALVQKDEKPTDVDPETGEVMNDHDDFYSEMDKTEK